MALPGTPVFAAPPGWNPKKKPNLVFGVVSDTHMRCHYDGKSFYSRYDVHFDDQPLVLVMNHFKEMGVDAILHCGDITDRGMVREMEFYKEAWDKVFGAGPRPANLIVTGNHDVVENPDWPKAVAKSKDPAVYKKLCFGSHNIKQEMERIWGEPFNDVWHKTVKGYHFFGFNWPPESPEEPGGASPFRGTLYHDSPCEGAKMVKTRHRALQMVELVRREREAGRLDTRKPFFTADHALNAPIIGTMFTGLHHALGIPSGMSCNGIHFGGHGHLSNAHFGFSGQSDNKCYPVLECSSLAYWKGHVGEGEKPRFAKGFGDGRVVNDKDENINDANHALLVRVYDDTLTIDRIWVGVKPKPAVGSLGETWVMPLNWGTGNGERGMGRNHPFHPENYAKVIGSPEFPNGAKLEVKIINAEPQSGRGAMEKNISADSASPRLCVKIPKADGNPDCRVYGYQIAVTGEDKAAALQKNCYARGYCMGMGHESDGGVTTVEIPEAELPAGKKLTIAVRPCSSLATKGNPLVATFNIATGMSKPIKTGA